MAVPTLKLLCPLLVVVSYLAPPLFVLLSALCLWYGDTLLPVFLLPDRDRLAERLVLMPEMAFNLTHK